MVQIVMDPFLKKCLHKEGKNTSLYNFSRIVLKKIKVHVQVVGKIPDSGPLLVIGNHPNVYDGFTLTSLFNRDDVWIVSAALNTKLGLALKKRILPVFLSHKPKENILDFFRVPYWTWQEKNLSRESAHRRNIQTISQAARKINANQVVIFFPSGTNPSGKRWAKGLGYLIEKIDNPQAQIVMTHIAHSQFYDFLRYSLFRYLLNWRVLHVSFSKSIPISTIKKIDKEERIAYLQSLYETSFD